MKNKVLRIRKHNAWRELLVTYKDEGVLARKVLHELQPLERNKTKFIQVAFDLGGRELVSSCEKIKSFIRT